MGLQVSAGAAKKYAAPWQGPHKSVSIYSSGISPSSPLISSAAWSSRGASFFDVSSVMRIAGEEMLIVFLSANFCKERIWNACPGILLCQCLKWRKDHKAFLRKIRYKETESMDFNLTREHELLRKMMAAFTETGLAL